jgi:hypothetical protein
MSFNLSEKKESEGEGKYDGMPFIVRATKLQQGPTSEAMEVH